MMKRFYSDFKCPVCSNKIEYAIFTNIPWFVYAGVPPYTIYMYCPSCKIKNPLAGQKCISSGRAIEIGGKEYPCSDVEPEYNPLATRRNYGYAYNVYDDMELRSKEIQSLGEEFVRCIEITLKERPDMIIRCEEE